jgi:hypothetical protein
MRGAARRLGAAAPRRKASRLGVNGEVTFQPEHFTITRGHET